MSSKSEGDGWKDERERERESQCFFFFFRICTKTGGTECAAKLFAAWPASWISELDLLNGEPGSLSGGSLCSVASVMNDGTVGFCFGLRYQFSLFFFFFCCYVEGK